MCVNVFYRINNRLSEVAKAFKPTLKFLNPNQPKKDIKLPSVDKMLRNQYQRYEDEIDIRSKFLSIFINLCRFEFRPIRRYRLQ